MHIFKLTPKTSEHIYEAIRFDGTQLCYEFIISKIKDVNEYYHKLNLDNITFIHNKCDYFNGDYYIKPFSINKEQFIILKDGFLLSGGHTLNDIKNKYDIE